MRSRYHLLGLCMVVWGLLSSPGSALAADAPAASAGTIQSRKDLYGRWKGQETEDLRCIVEFNEKGGKVATIKDGKHINTVHFWYNFKRREGIVTLGVSGQAKVLPKGRLLLELRPVNTNLVTVRNVIIERYESRKPKPEGAK